MSDHHNCPGLAECMTHPRWHVVRVDLWWYVVRFHCKAVATFPSHAEAINYATKQARKEQA